MELCDGVWLYEISKLEGLGKRDVSHVKAFVSERTIRQGPPTAMFQSSASISCGIMKHRVVLASLVANIYWIDAYRYQVGCVDRHLLQAQLCSYGTRGKKFPRSGSNAGTLVLFLMAYFLGRSDGSVTA